jgi:predicted MFS family arabinose efflux permease
MIFLALSLAPIGSVLGGVIGEWLGLRATIGLCGVGATLLVLAQFKFTPLPAMLKLPTPDAQHRPNTPPPHTPGAEIAA